MATMCNEEGRNLPDYQILGRLEQRGWPQKPTTGLLKSAVQLWQ